MIIDWEKAAETMRQDEADRNSLTFDVDGITLGWVRSGYFIEWRQMRRPADLLRWCHHLSTKRWFTPFRMRLLIDSVSARKGWKIYGQKRGSDRQKMTPGLRMSILIRDGFRCVLCHRTPAEDGIKLHVDHIKPIAAGGTTQR